MLILERIDLRVIPVDEWAFSLLNWNKAIHLEKENYEENKFELRIKIVLMFKIMTI